MDGGELCSARCAEQPFDVGFHPNSQIFVAGLITGEVEIWERDAARDAARKLKTVRCHDAACRTLAFVNDGALLLTGSSDRSILATDVATSKPLARLTNAHKAAVNRIVSIDAHTIASGDDDGVVKVWDTRRQTACGQFAPFVDFVSDIKDFTGFGNSLRPRHFRNMNESFNSFFQLNKCPVRNQVNHLTSHFCINWKFAFNIIPRVRGELLESK